MHWSKLKKPLIESLRNSKNLLFLTGAGISAASGIPTFRGKGGFWKEGSKHYQAEEISTFAHFQNFPEEVWRWFLYRKSLTIKATPNKGHFALAQLEKDLGDAFVLVSQNVDGLHYKAGNSLERTYHCHGDLHYTRCANACSDSLYAFPDWLLKEYFLDWSKETLLSHVQCPNCEGLLRPHVLWFDESYNEKFYAFQSIRAKADASGILFLIGTSGATFLPNDLMDRVQFFDGWIVDINPKESD